MKTGTGRQHLHPDADEEFIVKAGKLKLMVDGEWRMLAPGERFPVQRGVPHLFRNGHEGETVFTAKFTPAQQFLRFFLNMSLNTANHPEWYDERGEPPLVLQALAVSFQEVVHSAPSEEAEVVKALAIRGEPNGHAQECPFNAQRSRGHGAKSC